MKFALPAVAAILLSGPVAAEPFADWLDGVRAEALANGVGQSTLDAALRDLKGPLPRVLELDRKQWKRDVTLDWYLNRVISDERVDRGRQLGRRYRSLLTQVGEQYGVQPRFILAIWGIETHYGKITGGFPVLGALATLAFDGRRQDFFRGELLEALNIVAQERMEPASMLGSWAGAMGQSQFMPTSFSNFAQDYDGDGRRDIWTSEADVFASIAYYLKRHGWRDDITWGRGVKLPPGFDPDLIGLDVTRTIPEWQELGVRRLNGTDLPTRSLPASVVAPDYPEGDAFLVYENFRVTLAYNRSSFYATAVGILSDRIARGL
ncbi:MAG: lytic murein transglycosylase [Rhodospirillales bacterium]|nr:lytic murein transglycosylase [Rhodospirillales bacterium]MXX23561.1 lytic murein transglycosylase [Rhodospirillales bacterium]MYE19273.1 lytic murein transglycosylase [Rhodospirillales bacterium]